MKIAIIGAGFCGLAVAWHLLHTLPQNKKLSIEIFDSKPIGQGTSGIAAGLLHPFVGAHAKLNWRGLEGFQATKELLNFVSEFLGHPVTANDHGILRLALTETQYADFKICTEKYPDYTQWLDEGASQNFVPGCARAPALWIKNGLTVYSKMYLQGLWQSCAQQGAKFHLQTITSLKELSHFDLTIVATGAESLQIPELASLSLNLTKGQVLELSWPENLAPLPCALNSQVYLLMTHTRRSCLIGATFEKGYQTAESNIQKAQEELLPKALELFPPLKDARVLHCYAGMRAGTPQRRPMFKPITPSQWILTGMGSKGLLYHALLAKELVHHIFQ